MDCSTWAGQEALGQRRSTSPSAFTTGVWQTGHSVGGVHGSVPGGRFASTTETTLGMTSPPFSMRTVSPLRTSLRATSSSLKRLARATVVPARGDRLQHGHRRELARPADVDLDVEHDGGGLPRRVLERDGPARELRGEAQLLLEGEGVHLHHHAVDLVFERVAACPATRR